MNKKVKKTLKWTGITVGVIGTGVSAYVLVKHPEIRSEIVSKISSGCSKMKKPFNFESDSTPERKPVREENHVQSYNKPRYNNRNNKKNF